MKEILLLPRVTEKTSALIQANKYTFVVSSDATKVDVRNFVEKKYGVKVESVNVSKVVSKQRRRGKFVGMTKERKKAIVTLKEGQTLDAVKALY